jgi:hypothetical protein
MHNAVVLAYNSAYSHHWDPHRGERKVLTGHSSPCFVRSSFASFMHVASNFQDIFGFLGFPCGFPKLGFY